MLNTHRADILQRQAERQRAVYDLRETDVSIGQQVEAALSRLRRAREWMETYERETLPNLEKSLKEIQDLFKSGARAWTPCASWTYNGKC